MAQADQHPTSAAAAPVTAGIERFLRSHAPFSRMADEHLARLAGEIELGYYPKDSVILDPAQGMPQRLYIVQRGAVCHRPFSAGHGGIDQAVVRGPGECFSVSALLESRPVISPYVAVTDTFTCELPAAKFSEWLGRSTPLREFTMAFLANMLDESRRLLRLQHNAAAAEQQAMSRTLRSLIARAPVSCGPEQPAAEVLRTMQSRKIGSMLIVDAAGHVLGIFTRHDVLDRIALAGSDLSAPIGSVMTPNPLTLPAEASAYEAALLIADRGIRHVPVCDGGRIIGVVTERDLFALQRVSLRAIHRTVAEAGSLDELRAAAGDIRRLAKVMLGQGVSAQHLTLIISTLNDALTRRLIDLEQARHDLQGLRWCWLAFGSEGRFEQTISTDQDNGLVFDAGNADAASLRARLLPFAQAVNAGLDACGFPLCKGGIMAGNASCCLSLDEWRAHFSDWIANTDPQALLNSVIFFDLRHLHGDRDLADALQHHVAALAAGNARFRRQLAIDALRTRPPLGLISDFVTEEEGPLAGTLDLKASGARLFTDAARVLALAAGASHTHTVERLRQAAVSQGIPAKEIDAIAEAFYFLQTLRLRTQIGDELSGHGPNRLAPGQLNEVDRRVLKESLRQIRRLQSRLALDYGL